MNYYLAEACKNTFILHDSLELPSVDEAFLDDIHYCLQEEGVDDALILIHGQTIGANFYAKMLVLGLDGNFGEFCGNGARVCASYLFENYPGFEEYYLITHQGTHQLLQHEDEEYSVSLSYPSFDLNPKFVLGNELFGCTYVESIEPHLTIEQKMEDQELLAFGKKLNQQKEIFPKGININVWHVIDEDILFVKTYERGVQRLTKSCGTGSLSSCVCFKKEGIIKVITPGGKLEVTLTHGSAILKGPASFSYTEKTEKQD